MTKGSSSQVGAPLSCAIISYQDASRDIIQRRLELERSSTFWGRYDGSFPGVQLAVQRVGHFARNGMNVPEAVWRLPDQLKLRKMVTGIGIRPSPLSDDTARSLSSESQQGEGVGEIHESFGFALLAVPRGSDYTYPACQFEDDRTIAGLPEMLAARTVDQPWATLAFLVTPEDELGCSPVQVLQHQDPKLKDRAIRLARVAAGGDGFG